MAATTSKSKAALWMLITAAIAVWQFYDIFFDRGEAPSRGVLILDYVLLVCAVLGFIGNAMLYSRAKS